jgi:hypothetical protein
MKTQSPGRTCKIVVAGDVVTDHFLYEGRQRRVGSTIRLGTVALAAPGGAGLLASLLEAVAIANEEGGDEDRVNAIDRRLSVTRGFEESASGQVVATGYCLMRPHNKHLESKDQVWRMAEALGFSADDGGRSLATPNTATLASHHDIAVLDDAGLDFRRWPARDAWPRFLLDAAQSLPEWLVLKMSGPITAGDLWHTLVSGQTQDVEPNAIRKSAELLGRTIAVVSINDLRVEPVHVMKRLSWERTALELVHELRHNHSLAGLRRVRFVVISLDTDGALVAEFPPDGSEPRFRLVFDPARLEGDFESEIPGNLFGYQTCLVAAIVAHLARSPAENTAENTEIWTTLEQGVRAGLCAMRRLRLEGHGPVGKPHAPMTSGFPYDALAREITSGTHDWSYGITSIPPSRAPTKPWTIVAGNSPSENRPPLWGLARRVALRGVTQLTQTPYLQFGKLFTVERVEIERLRTLQRLLLSYQQDAKASKPLSIGVFGPPGSGKSFGVKELAKAVFSKDVPLLEFNLSQFQDPGELHGLFHQVRDCVLQGTLPVVFWDEFDSQNLKWLQYLLAPMQDGTFQDGQVTHPIGKSIFVFAGGTRSRFEDFGKPLDQFGQAAKDSPDSRGSESPTPGDLSETRKQQQDFIALKVPDFKSRLAGYLNVLGPNRQDSLDLTYPVRRALLLRVHLGTKPEAPLTIDSGLLTAFLEIGEYRHGARSLEKIAEQIRLASRTKEYSRSDLPSRNQLDLHVDADTFLTLVGA